MRVRVACIVEIPTPYRQPVFDLLHDRSKYDFHLFYLAGSQKDRNWNIPQQEFATYLKNWQICFAGYHTIHFNLGLSQLRGFDLYVFNGYAQPTLGYLLMHCWKKNHPYVLLTESHLGKPRHTWVKAIKEHYVRKVYTRSSANLVMSQASEDYVRFYGAPQKKIFRFPNTIDGPSYALKVGHLRASREELKRKWGIGSDSVILFVGTLNHRKGVSHLLASFISFAEKFPDTSLVMVGTGSLESHLRTRIQNAHLKDRVILPGFVQPENLPSFFAMADLFVLPSLDEPFGAVVCEAMAAGLPIITTEAVGAVPDFVFEGDNGLVIKPGDQQALSQAIERLLKDVNQRQKMGLRSKQIMQKWSHERLADEFERAVQAAIERK